jgi:adenylate cyclase
MPPSLWNSLQQFAWRWRGVAIAAPLTAFTILGLRSTGALQGLEWAAFDQYFLLCPAEKADDRIAIVGITESDLQTYGWPLPDQVLAELLQKVKQQQPRSIGLDLYRDLPVEPGYAALTKVFASTPNLIGIEKIGAASVAPPPVLKKLDQVSANDVVFDGDGKVRRGLLYLEDQTGENRLGLGMALSLLYLQKEGIEPKWVDDRILKLGQAQFPALEASDGSYVRANHQGYQLMINYRRTKQPFETVSVQSILNGQIDPALFRDRIILIGSVAESLKDFVHTPHGVQFLRLGEPTPGVEVHAQIVSQILSSTLQGRPNIQSWNEPTEVLWIAGWAFAGALVGMLRGSRRQLKRKIGIQGFLQRVRESSSVRWMGGLLLGSIGLVGATYVPFLYSLWIPVVPPLLGFWTAAIAMIGFQARNSILLRNTLGRYLTDEVVASLLETPGGLKLVGEKRKVTTLMADIRGFTSLSEQLPPEELVKLLNRFIAAMTTTIQNYGGTVNDLTGDGIVVFFGAPIQKPDDSERAVACAVAMQLAMIEVNQMNEPQNLPTLEIGIGINTGEVVLGNIGSEAFAKYTAIGSHVNLAARIESFTTGRQILISESTFSEVAAIARIISKLQTYVKGVQAPITLFEVGGMGEPYELVLPDNYDVSIALKKPIPLVFSLLKDKSIEETQHSGTLIKLSAKGAAIAAETLPPALSNLKINLLEEDERKEPSKNAIYAKTTQQEAEAGMFWVCFTDVPPSVAAALRLLRSDRRLRQ